MSGLDRITFAPNIMGGKACIRGMRVTVALILNLVASGMTSDEIIKAYPYLEPEDIRQALKYAAWVTSERILPAHTHADHIAEDDDVRIRRLPSAT